MGRGRGARSARDIGLAVAAWPAAYSSCRSRAATQTRVQLRGGLGVFATLLCEVAWEYLQRRKERVKKKNTTTWQTVQQGLWYLHLFEMLIQ